MAVRLSLVVVADDGELHTLHQLQANGTWSPWAPLGAPPGERLTVPTLASSLDGRLELFAFSTTNAGMWHRWQTAKYGGWHAWVREPDPPGVTWTEGNVAVQAGLDGRLELFCVNGTDRAGPLDQPNNDVWHRWQTTVNGSWSSWISHGQPSDAEQLWLLLARNSNNRLDLFAGVATSGTVSERFHTWHLPQTVPNGGWSPWQMLTDYPDPSLPYTLRAIDRNADGRLEAFATEGSTGTAWQAFQTSPSGPWHSWIPRGNPPGRALDGFSMVAANANGRLELFATANDGLDTEHNEIWHVRQTAPNNGWSAWTSLGSPGSGIGTTGSDLAVAASDDGRLELFATATDGNLWHRWQTGVNNAWSAWTNRGRPAGTNQVWLPVLHAS
jgi:hypothetical protein